MPCSSSTSHPHCRSPRRRGSATLWLVIWLPCLLVLFCALVGVANLWLARVELENALEAAALAAVKQWGEAGGGDTTIPRNVGVEYAAANILRRNPVIIGTNYNAANAPNQNDVCEPTDESVNPPNGNLVFGAINDDDPNNVIFNAGVAPSCASGTVMIDASASGNGNLAQDNAWGISFYNTADTPPALRITRVIIDLRGNGGTGSFTGPAVISDNSPQPAVHDSSANSQPDVVGFTDLDLSTPPAFGQVLFSYPSAGKLQIDFSADVNPPAIDDGFAPGDRIRFGQNVDGVSSGSGNNDGDGIGRDGTTVTVFFSLGGVPLPPLTGVVGRFVDNTESSNDCIDPRLLSLETGTFIVHPALVPDLPCPPTSAANNNGQSYVLLNANGSGKFGVRAQAISPVQPLGLRFLGNLTQYCVQAKATAEYDCLTGRVKLVRVDTFICP
jgi:Flp pilus assembly protein TadG